MLIRQPSKQTNAACKEGAQEQEMKIRSSEVRKQAALGSSFIHSFIHLFTHSFIRLLGWLQWLLSHLSASKQLFPFNPFSLQQHEGASYIINNHILPS